MPLTGTPLTAVSLKITVMCASSGWLTSIVGRPLPWMSKTRRVKPATAVPGRMRNTVPPLAPLGKLKRTVAGGAVAVGVAVVDADGRAVADAWVAVATDGALALSL